MLHRASTRQRICSAALLLSLPLAVPAANTFVEDGRFLLDLRLRSEQVNDDAFARDANALTLRTRLGWKSGSIGGFHLLIEAEDTRALDRSYDSTANGRVGFPVVADPESSEWNQAFIGWDSGSGSHIQAGRQRLVYDQQRFIGNVGWRQNEQTYDALSIRHHLNPATSFHYAWLDKVHRVFGNQHPNPLQAEHDLDAHLFNLSWKGAPGSLTGYAYLIENQDLPATSTRSLGLRHQRSLPISDGREWWYVGEYARQQGWRDAPATGSVDYLNLEFGLRLSGHGLRIGHERLGSNGRRAFQSPLATAHAFNGWADRFLLTPNAGLSDFHLKFDGPLGPLRYQVALHRFEAARGGADYGDELNTQLSWAFAKGWNALVKYADYRSDGFGRDVRKLWMSVEYRY